MYFVVYTVCGNPGSEEFSNPKQGNTLLKDLHDGTKASGQQLKTSLPTRMYEKDFFHAAAQHDGVGKSIDSHDRSYNSHISWTKGCSTLFGERFCLLRYVLIGGLLENIDGPGKWNKPHLNQGPLFFVSKLQTNQKEHQCACSLGSTALTSWFGQVLAARFCGPGVTYFLKAAWQRSPPKTRNKKTTTGSC